MAGRPVAHAYDVLALGLQREVGVEGGHAVHPRRGQAQRGGHEVEDFLGQDKSFKPAEEIRALLRARGATPDKNIISYCRLSHRATLAYFVMSELLGYPNVRSYDGSWTEWGSVIGVPIER